MGVEGPRLSQIKTARLKGGCESVMLYFALRKAGGCGWWWPALPSRSLWHVVVSGWLHQRPTRRGNWQGCAGVSFIFFSVCRLVVGGCGPGIVWGGGSAG